MSNSENNKRIAKNTLMLYFRQILIMLVSLYTVRVVLETLGAEDYGIFNVVAGVIVLFSFLNGAMTSATQRFLNFTMGQNNTEQARNVYSISFIIHILISILVIILAETVGLWFFYTWLNIPALRQSAAFVVYQFSVATTVINILRVPYYATIIAYEKMSFFALVSIIENVLKLGIVFLLIITSFDRLILYAFLVFLVGIIIFFVYKVYCNNRFEIAHFRYCNDKGLFRQLAVFSGWSIFGSFANMSNSQGLNILVNIFHGVTVNAAMGIATQVNSAVYQFVSNFQTAFNPQIIKSYAAEDHTYFMKLIFQTSKISFYLLFLFVLPLYINADFVLQIWLKNVPEYTVVFTRLILLFSLVDAISGPLWMSVQATGDIKKYQIIVSCFIVANLPLSFLFLRIGYSPVWVLIIKTGLNVLTFIWRMFFLRKRINLVVKKYFLNVIIPCGIVVLSSSVLPIFISIISNSLLRFFVSCFLCVICTIISVFIIGIDKDERNSFISYIKSFLG